MKFSKSLEMFVQMNSKEIAQLQEVHSNLWLWMSRNVYSDPSEFYRTLGAEYKRANSAHPIQPACRFASMLTSFVKEISSLNYLPNCVFCPLHFGVGNCIHGYAFPQDFDKCMKCKYVRDRCKDNTCNTEDDVYHLFYLYKSHGDTELASSLAAGTISTMVFNTSYKFFHRRIHVSFPSLKTRLQNIGFEFD